MHGGMHGKFRRAITFRERKKHEQWGIGCFYYILIFSKWSFEPYVATYQHAFNLVLHIDACMDNIFCTLCLKHLISKNKFKTKTKESLNSYFSARKNPSRIPHQAESCLKCFTKQNLKSLTTLGYPLHLVVEKYAFIQHTVIKMLPLKQLVVMYYYFIKDNL